MRILVTGGAGFIASHIVDAYLKIGHEVTVIDDLSTGRRENLNPKAEFIQLGIQDEKVQELFFNNNFDIVNHHAAQMDVRKSVAEPQFDAKVNILGTLNLLENCVKYKVKKFIFASTGGAVYGEQDIFPADEEHPTWPVSPYGISKLSCEKYLFYYKEVYNLSHVIFRYANVYGPRQSLSNPYTGVAAIFISRVKNNNVPIIFEDGNQTRDFVSVHDVVEANMLSMEKNAANYKTFNVGTGKATSILQVAESIIKLYNSKLKQDITGQFRKGDVRHCTADISKIKKELGFVPKLSFEEGMKELIEWSEGQESKDNVDKAMNELKEKGLL